MRTPIPHASAAKPLRPRGPASAVGDLEVCRVTGAVVLRAPRIALPPAPARGVGLHLVLRLVLRAACIAVVRLRQGDGRQRRKRDATGKYPEGHGAALSTEPTVQGHGWNGTR